MKAIANYDSKRKLVRLSEDNTNTDSGDLLRRGEKNVLTKTESQLNINIFGFGCNALIIHNYSKTALVSTPVDIPVLVTKIFGYFRVRDG
jgi:hypothetical protein